VYIGQDLQVAFPSYLNIDDISGSFNSVTTSFALTVNGSTPVPLPINSQQCLISVGGIIQRPDDTGTEGFRLSGSNIVFSSAPNTGEDFFGTILAGADYINAGVNFPDGQSGAPSITFDQDLDTGFFRSSSGAVSFSSNGVNTATLGSNSFTAPSFIPTSSSVPSNGVFLPAANSVAIATNGTQQATVDSSGRLLVGTSSARDFFGGADTPALQVEGIGNAGRELSVTSSDTSVSGGVVLLAKQRSGAVGGQTIVQSGDQLGYLGFQGSDGVKMLAGAAIEATVDGTPGVDDLPTRLVFSTTRDGQSSPSEAARILNDQTILVGKTTNDATSTGITLFGANSAAAGQFLAVSSADAGIFYRKTSTGGDGVILTKSNVGGTSTLVGAGFANGTFGVVSDATKKKNIETARNYLDDIKNIRVVKYNWNTDEDGTPKELGWIAQEVEQVFPGMVAELEGTKLLKKEVFVPMLMKCIQEQQAIIEGLEARLTALESA
jgi:hypothetical protein